ncbi:MAG: putative toxin-antitoxin system toxin component, PIN family [Acidobacteria bacterium]|nr:putative toxin-antitoxin system toxin component, PIN family [Acidobacteriota bacterium]
MSIAKASSPKIVLDTNVYFSAFTHFKGVPFRIWQQAVARSFTLLISPAIMRELARVFRQTLEWQEDEIVAHLKLIAGIAKIISPSITLAVFSGTMDADNRILECAVAGKAK